jgi:hypothetical protein
VLATISVIASRPSFSVIVPLASVLQVSSKPLTNGIMDGDQFGSIGERRLDLNVVDHFGMPYTRG